MTQRVDLSSASGAGEYALSKEAKLKHVDPICTGFIEPERARYD
jgi:hypothetical protein